MFTIIRPDYSSPSWEAVPGPHRDLIRRMVDLLATAPDTGLVAWLRARAPEVGLSYATLSRKYYALAKARGDWTALLDRRVSASVTPAEKSMARQPHFVAYLVTLAEKHQRKTAPAIRQLHRQWQARRLPIPGYETWPNWPHLPDGWHPRTLSRVISSATTHARMTSVRIGTSSKTNPFLPTVLTSRAGLWPLAVIQIDDVWHDHQVTFGKKRELVRVLELGALDLFTAHRFHWGCRPRRKKETGGFEGIGGKDARMFIAGMFHANGYSPNGTMIMSEHATAKVDEDIARALYDATHGRIRVDYQPIEGKQAALCGFWSGTEGGNFRAKAALESLHNLIHNDLAMLPMQTGSPSSGLKAPVTTDRIAAYIGRVLRDVAKHAPHRLDLLRLPTWDFHTDFIPFLQDYYHFGLASRTDHELEGWQALRRCVTEWTTAPGSGHYLSDTAFLALPDASQAIIRHAAQADPQAWSRRRNLSPLECWTAREKSLPIPPTVIADILGPDLAREVTARKGFLEFSDLEIATDPLIYQARFISGPMTGREIPHGEKVSMFALPFDDATAIVVDARQRFLGEVPLFKRVTPIDAAAFAAAAPWDTRPDIRSEDLRHAAGHKHSRIADILEPSRILHRDDVAAAQDLRAHNRDVIFRDDQAEAAAVLQAGRHTLAAGLQADYALAAMEPVLEDLHTDDLDF